MPIGLVLNKGGEIEQVPTELSIEAAARVSDMHCDEMSMFLSFALTRPGQHMLNSIEQLMADAARAWNDPRQEEDAADEKGPPPPLGLGSRARNASAQGTHSIEKK